MFPNRGGGHPLQFVASATNGPQVPEHLSVPSSRFLLTLPLDNEVVNSLNSGIKFVADIMLKKLARWMRILGYDTIYPDFIEDERILELAKSKRRILLTQDVGLASRAGKKEVRTLLIPRDVDVESQVAFVLRELKLSVDFPAKTLCPQCNGELEVVGKERVRGNENVPAGVLERNSSFWLCKSCKKVYWEGSHWGRIKKAVEKIKKELAD